MLVGIYDKITGKIDQIDLSEQQFQPLVRLQDDLSRYFLPTEGSRLIAISSLLPTRASPRSIKKANSLMREARLGNIAKRKPIEISRDEVCGRRLVLDGNSTILNAIWSDWNNILALEK